MTLSKIHAVASSIAAFSTGSADDVRDLATCVAALAQRQMDFAQLVHDSAGLALPATGEKISNWMDEQGKKTP